MTMSTPRYAVQRMGSCATYPQKSPQIGQQIRDCGDVGGWDATEQIVVQEIGKTASCNSEKAGGKDGAASDRSWMRAEAGDGKDHQPGER